MKKIISFFLCAIIMCSLIACSDSGQKTPPAKPAETGTQTSETSWFEVTEPVTIEFWHNYGEKVKQNWLENAGKAFSESQDLVTVEVKHIGSYNVIDEQITAAQAAGKGLPALSAINCPRVQTYSDSGMLEPLGEYIKDTGYDIEDFNEGMIDAMILDSDGKVYGMPLGISSACVYWNYDLLKEAGITKIPETWNELREIAPIIREKTGKKAFSTLSELNYIEVLMRNAGADPLADGVTADLHNEDIVKWVKEYKEMIDAGEADLFIGPNNLTDIATAFYAQEYVCMVNTITIVNQVDENSDFEVVTSFALKNKLDPPISCVAGAAVIIPAANDQNVKNAAWEFLSFLLNKENVTSWSFVSGTYPVRASVYSNPDILQDLYNTQPLYKDIYAGLSGVVSKNKTPYQTAAYRILLNAMGRYFYDGADFDTVWKSAEEEINYLLAGN